MLYNSVNKQYNEIEYENETQNSKFKEKFKSISDDK